MWTRLSDLLPLKILRKLCSALQPPYLQKALELLYSAQELILFRVCHHQQPGRWARGLTEPRTGTGTSREMNR